MSWERGRADIERLIADGELERVPPSDEGAARLLSDAEAHIALASKGVEDDPAGALQLSYDAARKASASLLAIRGLRATSRGGRERLRTGANHCDRGMDAGWRRRRVTSHRLGSLVV